jgi:hypothetical protein
VSPRAPVRPQGRFRDRAVEALVCELHVATAHHVLIAQAGRDGRVSKVVHRLHQVADAGYLSPGEVTQVVYPNPFAANGFQSRRECIADNLVGQVAATTGRREQQRLGVGTDVSRQVVATRKRHTPEQVLRKLTQADLSRLDA